MPSFFRSILPEDHRQEEISDANKDYAEDDTEYIRMSAREAYKGFEPVIV